ncbi:MAG: OmpA family protein [Rhodospirillales bacterium]|jgi:outer membrane protein OmpA-like peptidoglycan-associated protein|nr:OmpA family protein [Rhodospirillales bacterium]
MRRILGLTRGADDHHWISVSDLMAGLMVLFLFIAITYIRPIVETQNKIREIVVAWNESEVDIHKALEEEFEKDLSRWGAELIRETLTIRFKSPDVLFDTAEATLKPEFKQILSEFFPRYLDVLNNFSSAIDEVRIEGHTSSEWIGVETQDEAYFRNMALSQARTRSVLEYCLGLPTVETVKSWAKAHMTANGLSSSRLILRDNAEDKVRSRRVEFRIRTNTKEQIVRVLETIK